MLLKTLPISQVNTCIFFPMWVFFHGHSRITGLHGKGEGILLTPHYHVHPLHRHFDIDWVITAESSPLHIASSRIWTGNASRLPLSYVPFLVSFFFALIGLFLIKLQTFRFATLLKRDSNTGVFLWNLWNF